MYISRKLVCLSLLFIFAASGSLRAQESGSQDTQASCRKFVQEFYDWYVQQIKKAESGNGAGGFDLTLKYKKASLSDELFRQLKADSDAEAKAKGDLVGLDFDPFLNAQDVGERYTAEKVIPQGGRYRVEVYALWDGKKNEKPDVVPELMMKDGQWIFVNFIYGEGADENLLSVLKSLADERRKNHK
jgi:hypothetical protein